MSKLALFVSGTIVLIFMGAFAKASPQPEVPESKTIESEPEPRPGDENLAITTPPPRPLKPLPPANSNYFPYRQALTFRLGIASDPETKKLTDRVVGFQYLFPKFLSPKLEGGADLHEDGRGHLHAGVRWIWYEKTYFRPSLKIALDHLLKGTDNLATWVKIDNYFIRGGGAVEYTFSDPYSVRIEAEVFIGTKEVGQEYTLGISRAW